MGVTERATLEGYFYERLRLAQRRAAFQTDRQTEHYLVEMLVRFGRSDAQGVSSDPLCVEVAQAEVLEDPRERLRCLRRVGDTALYSCGLFPDALERRGVTTDYLAWLGRNAYGAAGVLASFSAEPFQQVYPRLRSHFEAIARVLTEVLEEPAPDGPDAILRMYRRWRRTGSAKLARALQRAGVQLGGNPTSFN